MFGRLIRKYGSLMSVIAALVVLALEYAGYRKEHTFSLFWVGVAITMLVVGVYEMFSKRVDDKSPLE
jgi:putative effector of murein hydrolase